MYGFCHNQEFRICSVTNIGCKESNNVNVYDSMYHHCLTEVQQQIACIMETRCPTIIELEC